jgi:hypothetical protein
MAFKNLREDLEEMFAELTPDYLTVSSKAFQIYKQNLERDKESKNAYGRSPAGRAAHRRYVDSEKFKQTRRKYDSKRLEERKKKRDQARGDARKTSYRLSPQDQHAIAYSTEPTKDLAARYGISVQAVRGYRRGAWGPKRSG